MSTRPELSNSRLPTHLGIIPDGNRRWAQQRGLNKEGGYAHGVQPGVQLCELCIELKIREITYFGFTEDNTKRPAVQRRAFQRACVAAVRSMADKGIPVHVVGNTSSSMFPEELREFTGQPTAGAPLKVNLLVNYSWQWDLGCALNSSEPAKTRSSRHWLREIGSSTIPRIDMVIRWGGRCRLSGFLPVQTVYSDVHVVDAMWPEFRREHVHAALAWYQHQDATLGG